MSINNVDNEQSFGDVLADYRKRSSVKISKNKITTIHNQVMDKEDYSLNKLLESTDLNIVKVLNMIIITRQGSKLLYVVMGKHYMWTSYLNISKVLTMSKDKFIEKSANESNFKFRFKKDDLLFSFVRGKKQVKIAEGSKVYTFHVSIMGKSIRFIKKTMKDSKKNEFLLDETLSIGKQN